MRHHHEHATGQAIGIMLLAGAAMARPIGEAIIRLAAGAIDKLKR